MKGVPLALHRALEGRRVDAVARVRGPERWGERKPWYEPAHPGGRTPLGAGLVSALIGIAVVGTIAVLARDELRSMRGPWAVAVVLLLVSSLGFAVLYVVRDVRAMMHEDDWCAATQDAFILCRKGRALVIPWSAFVGPASRSEDTVVLTLRARDGTGVEQMRLERVEGAVTIERAVAARAGVGGAK